MYFHFCIHSVSASILLEQCTPFGAASQVLQRHGDEFVNVVDPHHNLPLLTRKGVIPKSLSSKIEKANPEAAKEMLFEHLHRNADVAALREYCNMATAAKGFPKMQKLGKKMLTELALKGLLVQ